TCLQIINDKPLAESFGLYSPENADCLPAAKIPTYSVVPVGTERMKKFYPYLFTSYGESTSSLRDYAYGAKQLGWFDGLTKLGVLTQDCNPEFLPQLLGPLAEIGYPKDQIALYDFGCSLNPADAQTQSQQAVLQFKTAGVTHVLNAGVPAQYFATVANQQGYNPKYATSDVDATLQTSQNPSSQPDPASF